MYFKDLRAHQNGWTVLVEGVAATFTVDDFHDVFYVLTNDGAPRYRIYAVDRVDPMHAHKFTGLLQWATASAAPVWLRIQADAGHGGADQVKQKIDQNADTYAFLMWQLSMK